MHAHNGADGYLPLVAAWQLMMLAMMAPVVWPWIGAYARFVTAPASVLRRGALTTIFGSGYFTAWLGYSAVAAGAQLVVARFAGAHLPPRATAIVLAGAGLYQFAPLKRACLVHCRNPLTYFLRRWYGGPSGGFRLGFGHGLYCVGCCWALMLTMIAVGETSVRWMVAIAAVTFVEQAVPGGWRMRKAAGVAMVAAAAWIGWLNR